MKEAFVYRWRELDTNKWYIGYHGGTPDDGYICSSLIVRPLIQANPDNWIRKILRSGSKQDMVLLEKQLLTRLNASKNPMSYNRSNGQGHFDGGRPEGIPNRKLGPLPIPRQVLIDYDVLYKNKNPNTINPKTGKPKISSRGGARKGAGRPKGTKDNFGAYHLMKSLNKINVKTIGLSLDDAKRLNLKLENIVVEIKIVENTQSNTTVQPINIIDIFN
jgi:hypothetical protein